ncbi:hypothetical protein ANTQUA_LOCUS7978 [Anthophora quadrimaculata]
MSTIVAYLPGEQPFSDFVVYTWSPIGQQASEEGVFVSVHLHMLREGQRYFVLASEWTESRVSVRPFWIFVHRISPAWLATNVARWIKKGKCHSDNVYREMQLRHPRMPAKRSNLFL